MNQDLLLAAIRKKILPGDSLLDVLSAVLSISYDAAHRRVSSKSKFSIDEAVALCRHFNLSMDAVLGADNKVVVEKTKEIHSFADLADYFATSADYLERFQKQDAVMYYSAKDIPLFHTVGGTLLSKFKLYVWMTLLTGSDMTPFSGFTIPEAVLPHSSRLRNAYANMAIREIWNDTTINSTLQQIDYFSESGLLTPESARALYKDVRALLAETERRCSRPDARYDLYHNELLILNNNVLVCDENRMRLFVPYTMLGYFITGDEVTCRHARDYFLFQLQNSKSLNHSGTRDRKIFFSKMLQKVAFYETRLTARVDLSY